MAGILACHVTLVVWLTVA